MWDKKVVCVAGGSRGFGLQIARAFHQRGASVVLLARNAERVDEAASGLNASRPESAVAVAVDLSDDQQRERAIAGIVEQVGRVDVWINAVGQSIRVGFDETQMDDYRQLMEQNFFVSVGCTIDVLPHLQATGGSLVNIGSLAAKTSWRFLSPYVTSKHALAGFAKQLRLEGPSNVHFLFVCPGPIQSDQNESRYEQQASELPDNANRPGAGAPVRAIDPEWLAEKIVGCCERRTTELIVPRKSRLLFTIAQLFPNLGDWLIKRMSK